MIKGNMSLDFSAENIGLATQVGFDLKDAYYFDIIAPNPDRQPIAGSISVPSGVIGVKSISADYVIDYDFGLRAKIDTPTFGNIDINYPIDVEFVSTEAVAGELFILKTFSAKPSSSAFITGESFNFGGLSLEMLLALNDGSGFKNIELLDTFLSDPFPIGDILYSKDGSEPLDYFTLFETGVSAEKEISDALKLTFGIDGEEKTSEGLIISGSFDDFPDLKVAPMTEIFGLDVSVAEALGAFPAFSWMKLLNADVDKTIGNYEVKAGYNIFDIILGGSVGVRQVFDLLVKDITFDVTVDGELIADDARFGDEISWLIPENYSSDLVLDWSFDFNGSVKPSVEYGEGLSAEYKALQGSFSVGKTGEIPKLEIHGNLIGDLSTGQVSKSKGFELPGILDDITSILLEFDVDDYFSVSETLSFDVKAGEVSLQTASFNDAVVDLELASLDALAEMVLLQEIDVSDAQLSNVKVNGSGDAAFVVDKFSIAGLFNFSGGFLLSSGGLPGNQNTNSGFSVSHGTAGDVDLTNTVKAAFSGAGETQDASSIEFTVNVTNEDVDGLRFDMIFGSDEYPEYSDSSFVDIAAVYVNGVNVALFNNNPQTPLSVTQKNIDAGNFIDNQTGKYGIEWDGFSNLLSVRAKLESGLNTVKIAVADTGDQILDSGLYVGNIELLKEGAVGSGVLSVLTSNDNNVAVASIVQEEIKLNQGAATIVGSKEALNGDFITNFDSDDQIVFESEVFSSDNISVTYGSAILDIDLNNDNVSDVILILEGDFSGADFVAEQVEGNTIVKVVFSDQEIYGDKGDQVISGGGGNDILFTGLGNNELYGKAGNDKLTVLSGINLLEGGDGSDFLKGGIQSDRLIGGAGDDIILGDVGSFFGGSDVLEGGLGNDLLMGGRGADTFVFKPSSGADTIAGFEVNDILADLTFSKESLFSDFISGVDKIYLDGFKIVDASNVKKFVSDSADGSRFSAEGTDILFYGVAASQIGADDFIF